MRVFLAVVLSLHGLIHMMGMAKAFGLAELPQLSHPISRGAGIAWLSGGIVMLLAATALLLEWDRWWLLAGIAAVLSQILVFSTWSDARFGTLANLIVLAAATYGFAAHGPMSFEAAYERATSERLARVEVEGPVTEADLAHLPAPVRRYVRVSGAVGQPAPRSFGARWRGRIRRGADQPWMSFTAEQRNFAHGPSRFFHMKARRHGLPVDVLHTYVSGRASMKVRLLSLYSLAHASGPEMDRSETVTLFNDMCVLAPGSLIDPAITWEPIDSASARGHLTVGDITVSAVLMFNEAGELVDFVSDDRSAASPDGTAFTPMRWSTPLTGHRRFGPYRVMSRGEGVWHATAGAFTYVELELEELSVN